MFRVIIKDFLEKGVIKTDNGIPIPLEKVEEKDLEPLLISITYLTEHYCKAIDDALADFKDAMEKVPDRDLTLKNVPTLQTTFEEVVSDFKDSIGATLLNMINYGMDFVPFGPGAKTVFKGVKEVVGPILGKMEEQAKLNIGRQ